MVLVAENMAGHLLILVDGVHAFIINCLDFILFGLYVIVYGLILFVSSCDLGCHFVGHARVNVCITC